VTNQIDKALASYEKALAINPKSTAARDRQITLYLDTNKLDEAERQTKAILNTNSKDSSGRLFDGRLKLAHNQAEQALAILQPLSAEEPRSPVVHHFLGMAYAKKGDLPQAIQELNKAIEQAPNSIESHGALAAIYLSQGSADLAIEQAQAVLRLNPRSVPAATIMGEAYLRKNDTAKAGQVFESITKTLPNHALAHHRLGLIARSNKKDADALAHFEQALKANPDFIEPLAQIATDKVNQGKPAEARDRLLKQRDVTPKNPLLHVLLGQFYASTKQFDQAEQAFKQAMALDDNVLDAYTGLASLYVQSKKMDLAAKEYKTALSKNPKLIAAHMVLGMIYESQQKYDDAQASFQEVLKINPRFAPAANNLAWLLMERGGNLDVALSYAQTAREVMPNDPNIADTLGWIYYQKKVYLLATVLLKEAAEKISEDPIVVYHYGMAIFKSGSKSEAKQWLEKSLTLNPNHQGAAEVKATLATMASTP